MASQPAPEPIKVSPPPVIARAVPPEQASLAALLQYEAEVRRQPTEAELVYHVANESRRIVAYDQMFVLRHARIGDGYHVIAASSLSVVDRNAPLIAFIEASLSRLDVSQPQAFDAAAYAKPGEDALDDYPFHAWHWQPMRDGDGVVFAGLLIARTEPLREGEAFRVGRIAETVEHSWRALAGGKPVKPVKKLGKRERRGDCHCAGHYCAAAGPHDGAGPG